MKKRLSFILALLLSFSFLFSLYPVPVTAASVVCRLEGEEYAELTIEEETITLPDTPEGLSGAFAGWSVIEDGKEKLYAPGATVTAVSGQVYEGVVLSFITQEGARMRYSNDDIGIRFLTRFDKVDYNRLRELVGDEGISFGTYVTAREYMFSTDFVFTPEALAEAGCDRYLDIKAKRFFTEEKTYYTISGSVKDILDENRARAYVAVGYLKLVYADGSTGTVYSPFDYNKNCATPYDVTLEAYEDRYFGYPHTVPAGHIHGGRDSSSSLYSLYQLDMMKAFLDSVIAVDLTVDAEGEYSYIPKTGKYYTSPWLVSYAYESEKDEIFSVTVTAPEGKSVRSACSFLFVGSRIPLTAEGVTVTDTSIVARHSNFTPEY